MREILFRDKRTDNGEWVQGYPCRYGWTGKEKDYIIPDYASALYTAEIDPETGFFGESDTSNIYPSDFYMCEIVGNVFDTPEFFEAGVAP